MKAPKNIQYPGMESLPVWKRSTYADSGSFIRADSGDRQELHDGITRGFLEMKLKGASDICKKYVVGIREETAYEDFKVSSQRQLLIVCNEKCSDSNNGIPPRGKKFQQKT